MKKERKPVIAIVDDDRNVLESLKDLLESGGYRARAFPSAVAFLESGALLSVRCVISDVCMPAMTGWELEERAKHARPGLPVILITGYEEPSPQQRLTAEDGRVRILFRKPFDAQQLLAAVGAALTSA